MRSKLIHDDGEPVLIRKYPNEALAELAKAVLEGAEIPAMLTRQSYSEVRAFEVGLVVRRKDVKEALAVLDDTSANGGVE